MVKLHLARLLSLAGLATSQVVDLGTASAFGVLGGSAVTNSGPSSIDGNVGVSPGSAVTGFPPGTVTDGNVIYRSGAVPQQAQDDITTAYNDLAGRASDTLLTGQDLDGLTLVAGVYAFSASAQLTGDLTLDAEGDSDAVFIFQVGTTLNTATASSVLLANGASYCNVFWQVGSSASIGTTSAFVGNILALQSISFNTGASSNGGLYARNGAVTLLTNNIISPQGCEGAVTSLPPTSTATSTSAGASSSDAATSSVDSTLTTTSDGASGTGSGGGSGSTDTGASTGRGTGPGTQLSTGPSTQSTIGPSIGSSIIVNGSSTINSSTRLTFVLPVTTFLDTITTTSEGLASSQSTGLSLITTRSGFFRTFSQPSSSDILTTLTDRTQTPGTLLSTTPLTIQSTDSQSVSIQSVTTTQASLIRTSTIGTLPTDSGAASTTYKPTSISAPGSTSVSSNLHSFESFGTASTHEITATITFTAVCPTAPTTVCSFGTIYSIPTPCTTILFASTKVWITEDSCGATTTSAGPLPGCDNSSDQCPAPEPTKSYYTGATVVVAGSAKFGLQAATLAIALALTHVMFLVLS